MPAPLARRRAAAALSLVAAGWLAGCSGDRPVPIGTVDRAPAPSQADVAEGLAALYAGPGTAGTAGTPAPGAPGAAAAREADCFGAVLAGAVPAGALEEAGLVVDGRVVEQAPPLPEQLARQWFAAQQSCADFVEVSARAQLAATKGRLDAGTYAACLRRAIAPARVEAAVVATLAGRWDDPAVAELGRAQSDCAALARP